MNQKKTVELLQNLLFSENKPPELRPVDILLLNYLILRQTEDHCIYDSHLTLAQRLGCERRTIADSIKRLSTLGWIVNEKSYQWSEKTKRKTRSIGRTSGLSVNLEKLPQPTDRAKHSPPSPEAVALATGHTALLMKHGLNRRQPKTKTFDRQQALAAQRLIDEFGSEKAYAVLNFALSDARYTKAAQKSLYEVRSRLPALRRAYDAAHAQLAQPVADAVA